MNFPTGPFYYIHQLDENLQFSILRILNEGLNHINETMHKLRPKLLGGWLGSNVEEGCDKRHNAPARCM